MIVPTNVIVSLYCSYPTTQNSYRYLHNCINGNFKSRRVAENIEYTLWISLSGRNNCKYKSNIIYIISK